MGYLLLNHITAAVCRLRYGVQNRLFQRSKHGGHRLVLIGCEAAKRQARTRTTSLEREDELEGSNFHQVMIGSWQNIIRVIANKASRTPMRLISIMRFLSLCFAVLYHCRAR